MAIIFHKCKKETDECLSFKEIDMFSTKRLMEGNLCSISVVYFLFPGVTYVYEYNKNNS